MKLILGDCLEEMKSIPDNIIDAIITDPPYGTSKLKWDFVIPIDEMWEQLNRIIKPNGIILLFGKEPFSSKLRLSNIDNYRYDLKWDRVIPSTPQLAKYRPLNIFEDICVFYKSLPIYNPIMTERGRGIGRGNRKTPSSNKANNMVMRGGLTRGKKKYPTNKLTFNRMAEELHSSKVFHPTQKPVELMEYLVKTYTNENDTVLDFTMGSGTTGIACVNTNRNFIGIELDKEYFNIANKRIETPLKQIKQAHKFFDI